MVFRFILKPEALDGVLAKCLNSSGHLADFILAVHTFDFAGCIACRQRPHPLAKPRNRSGNATRRNKQSERDQCQETSAMLTRAVQIVVLVLAVRRSLPSFITWISCSLPALIFGETSVIFRRTLSAIC